MSGEAQDELRETPELDYLTHIVMRLYENKQCVGQNFKQLEISRAFS